MENKIVALISKYYIVFVGIYISICNVNLFKIAIFRLLASDGSGRVMEIIISQKRIFKKIFFFQMLKMQRKSSSSSGTITSHSLYTWFWQPHRCFCLYAFILVIFKVISLFFWYKFDTLHWKVKSDLYLAIQRKQREERIFYNFCLCGALFL